MVHRMLSALTCALCVTAGAANAAPSKGAGGDTAFVHIGAADAGAGAFVAWPVGDGQVPAVIVVHEWWGLDDGIRDVARKLARQGYAAIVPDLYHGKVASDAERAHELSRGLDNGEALDELDAASVWLRAQSRTAKTKLGVVGFCMGGGLAQQYALRNSELCAAVMFYGSPELDPTRLAALKVPLQGHFGVEDEGIPPARIDQFKAALAKAGKTADLYEYDGAGHAFMHEGRTSYRADAARQAWARTLAFLQKHLKS